MEKEIMINFLKDAIEMKRNFGNIKEEMIYTEILNDINKLQEYEDLEEQNRLIRLPFPLNSIIYKVAYPAKFCGNYILEFKFGYEHIEQVLKSKDYYFATLEETKAWLKELEG